MALTSKHLYVYCLFSIKKELIRTGGCVEKDDPWQLRRTIGPLRSQRFLLASAKAQPRGKFVVCRGVGVSGYAVLSI